MTDTQRIKAPLWRNLFHEPIILLVIIIFALCIRLVFFAGVGMTDVLSYAENAYNVSKGSIEISRNVHHLRLGLFLPAALGYRLWGVNEISSAIYPLLCSLGNLVLAFYLSKLLFDDILPGLISAMLLAVFPLEVFYSSQLMPEIPLSFFMGLCLYFFLKGEQTSQGKGTKWYYILSGVVGGVAYLTKIFAVFLVLFFLAYIIYKKRVSMGYIWMGIGFCCVLLPEMIFYYLQTGGPLYRFSSIVSSPGSRIQPNPGKMFRSDFFIYPYYWFISVYHFGFFYYFIIFAVLYSLWYKLRETYIPMLWAGSLFLYLQFGREGKHLIHKEARFLSIITIPCLIILGYVLTRILSGKKKLIFWLILCFLGITSLVFIAFQQTLQRSEVGNLREIANYVQQLPDNTDIYIDSTSGRYIRYFLGYKNPIKSFIIHNATTGESTYPVDLYQLHQAIVIVNWNMINTLQSKGITYIKFQEILYDPPPSWQVVHTIQTPDNWVYSILRPLQESSLIRYLPTKIAEKMSKTVERVLKSHKEKTIIYRINE